MIASHNTESWKLAIKTIQEEDIPSKWFAFGQLKGFSDSLSYSIINQGFNWLKYLPFGPTEYLIPYLIRRGHESKQVMREHLFLDEISDEIYNRLRFWRN